MKNVSRFTALALVLLLLVSLCGAASASSGFFPDYQMLLDFCGGDTTKASAEMERYNAWYVTFISQYGDPSYSPYARSQFSSAGGERWVYIFQRLLFLYAQLSVVSLSLSLSLSAAAALPLLSLLPLLSVHPHGLHCLRACAGRCTADAARCPACRFAGGICGAFPHR